MKKLRKSQPSAKDLISNIDFNNDNIGFEKPVGNINKRYICTPIVLKGECCIVFISSSNAATHPVFSYNEACLYLDDLEDYSTVYSFTSTIELWTWMADTHK